MITKFEQVEKVLNELVADYLSDLGDNCDEDGTIDFGDGVIGYDDKNQLIKDFILYLECK